MLTTYLVCTIGYVIVVGALMERSENQRFRFDVDPMIWLLLLAAAHEAWRTVRFGRRGRPATRGANGSVAMGGSVRQ